MRTATEPLPDGTFVELVVGDDGPGIAPELQSRIFEPFFTTKGEVGTGLGLASVLDLATRAGGGASVDSRPGAGARFSVFLPLARA